MVGGRVLDDERPAAQTIEAAEPIGDTVGNCGYADGALDERPFDRIDDRSSVDTPLSALGILVESKLVCIVREGSTRLLGKAGGDRKSVPVIREPEVGAKDRKSTRLNSSHL